MIPIYLFWNYLSSYPWYLGPILQVLGLVFLWVTRYTGRFYPRWGKGYYLFSAIVRPSGIILIAWGWLEIFSVRSEMPRLVEWETFYGLFFLLTTIIFLCDSFLRRIIFILIIVYLSLLIPKAAMFYMFELTTFPLSMTLLALAWALWSIFKLGLRRSFLYVRMDDPLITTGPYAYQRHPQFLAAILLAFSSISTLAPTYEAEILIFQLINLLVLIAGLVLITVGEEQDLVTRFGEDYIEYRKSAPGLIGFGPKTRHLTWKRTIRWAAPVYLLSLFFLFSGLMVSWDGGGSNMIYFKQKYYDLEARYRYTKRNLQSIGRRILEYRQENETFPKNLDEIVNRPSRSSSCPQSIFYCGETYFFPEKPSDKGAPRRRRKINLVKKLPFELECTKTKIEMAQAMNCDEDDHLHVWVAVIDVSDQEGEMLDVLHAMDDRKNVIIGDFRLRVKQNERK